MKAATAAQWIWQYFFPEARKRGGIHDFLLTILLMALALWVRLAIAPVNAGLQYITFFPAITLAAIAGGYRTGLLATAIGLVFATTIFTPPYYSFSWLVWQSSFWSNAVFLTDGVILSASIEAMHHYRQRYQHELWDVKASEAQAQKLNDQLLESEARLQALLNTSAIGLIVIDEQGRMEEFNQASETIFAYSKEEALGRNVSMLMPEPYQSEHDGYLKNHLTGGVEKVIGFGREVVGRRKDGTLFPMDLNVGKAQLNEHSIFVGFIQDVSQRKLTESMRRKFEAIVQSSDDAIISKTLDSIVTSWNPSAETMFGYTPEEMLGQSILKLIPAERIDEEQTLLNKIAQGQRVSNFETVRICKDGSLIDVSVCLSPIFDESGTVTGVSKIARDITSNKRLERQLVDAKQVAEAANQSKSEFLANMSHEIRTPMNAIIGLTSLAMETGLNAKQLDYLTKVQTASQALLAILNDVLDLAKIESGRLDIERIEFDPTIMLQSVADLFMAKAEEKGLEIFLEVSPDIPLTVIGDPLRIRQILSNLVGNAIKFTAAGEIHIRMDLLESNNDGLQLNLSVRDTGIGIDEPAIEHLFQPFNQADASITRKFGGTGLGLSISKQLVKLLGGNIEVSSRLGQGSTFSFSIHCEKGQAYNWSQDSHLLKDTYVLVVDDQETSCSILQSTLESWQFRVQTALSAEQGLEKIYAAEQAGAPFDLLLLDWQMQGMNGLQLIQALRQKERLGELTHPPAIIMVTAYSKEQLLNEAAVMPVHLDAILDKPVVPSSLLNTILHVYHYQGKEYQVPATPASPYAAAEAIYNARILLVEDNALNQQVAGEFLEKAGLRVCIAGHGGEAIQWLQKERFAAVLMDLQMPEMDGFEATRRIRQLPGCANLPIIAMTAAAMQHDRETCLDAGMNDHIAKPINPRELINTLLHWIEPTGQSPTSSAASTDRQAWPKLAGLLPGFELDNIMLMLNGNQQQLLDMLASFRRQFIGEAAIINAKIEAGDLQDAEKRLHALKGTAGNLGAAALHQATAALDAQLIAGHYEPATWAAWLETFDATLQIIAAAANTPTVVAGTLMQALAEMDTLLINRRFINDQLLAKIGALLPADSAATFDRLSQYIIDTDYANARSTLKALMELPNGQH